MRMFEEAIEKNIVKNHRVEIDVWCANAGLQLALAVDIHNVFSFFSHCIGSALRADDQNH